jgi:acetolactate synthase I/II/III large subunit
MAEQSDTLSSGLGRPSRGLYGSDLMVEVLRELGIRYVALNPGASYRGLHDSLVNFSPGEPPEIVLCTHEEIAVALANGYTRATGAPMATALHNVVGLLHASMAIFNAWCDRTPMLNLGGGGPQDATLRRSTDWVHTALVQGNLVRDFVKYDDQPYSLESVPESLLRAYRIATTDPKGPVYVCLDADLQEQRMNAPLLVPDARLYRAPAAPAPNPEALREVADLLVKAEWPVIVAGEVGRTPQALVPLRELAETLAAPVIDADGRFAFPNTHSLDLTAAREQALRAADVVLALDVPSLGVPLGPSLRERQTLELAVRPGTKIVHITLLECERQSFVSDTMWLVPVAVPIAAHTSIALPQLLELCRHQLGSQADAATRIEARRVSAAALRTEAHKRSHAWIEQNWQQKPISSARLYGELNSRLKGQSWALVHAHGRRWREVLEVTESGHGIGGGRGAGVGYGLPASIGAALAYKGSGRLCVSVLGDGDFLMTSNALWTAARYSIPLLIMVFNNRSYYNDEEHQERMAVRRERPVDNKGIGVDLKDPAPDLAAMARALSVEGFGPITEPDQLGPTLDRAIEIVRSGQPAVIDVVTQPR